MLRGGIAVACLFLTFFTSTFTRAAWLEGVEDVGAKLDADCPSQEAATVFMMQSKLRFAVEAAQPVQSHPGIVAQREAHRFNHSRRKYRPDRPVGHDVFGFPHMPTEIDFEVRAGVGGVPAQEKWVLALLEVLALGFFGIDRCYMGQVVAGIVKGFTLGGLGVWFFLDYVVIMITCLSQSPFINALGYHADFVDGAAGINTAFILATLSVCMFPIIFTAAAVAALHAYTAKPLPVAELDKQKVATDPNSEAPSAPQDGARIPDTYTAEEQLQVGVETEEEKEWRRNQAKEARLMQFGEAVPFSKLLSLASNFELFVFGCGFAGAVLQGALQPLLFVFMGRLLDAAAVDVDEDFMNRLKEAAILMIVAGACASIAAFAQSFGMNYFAELQVAKMRPLYFRALLYRDIGWFDTHDAESLPTDLDEDMQSYRVGMGMKLGASVSMLAQVIVSLIMSCICCWEIAIVLLAAIPATALSAPCFAAGQGQSLERQIVYSHAAKLVDEVLFAIRTVVAFGAEQKEIERYGKAVEEATWGGIKKKFYIALGMAWVQSIFLFSMGFAFYVGMLRVVGGHYISVGRISSAVYLAIIASSNLGNITPGFIDLYTARKNIARFFHVLETQGDIQKHVNDEREKCPPIRTLELVNVHFAYPARPDIQALKDVTLKIEKGQRVAVVGESGGGKSTIMALLERFYDPVYGVVLVNGLNLRQFNVKSYRSQIGYVGQEPVLFADSVKNNIMLGCEHATMNDLVQVAKYANLEFVDILPSKFETYVGTGGSQFSGGQKQRIAIARALIKGPSFLFFDEATSALDTASERTIQKAIDNITTSSELGVTTLTIAHRLCTVKSSDVIYVMRQGELVEQGTHSVLTSQSEGIYKSLAAMQGLVLDTNGKARDEEETNDVPIEKVAMVVEQNKKEIGRDEEEKLRLAEVAASYSVPWFRLLEFCRPEWWAFFPALLGAMTSGALWPVLGAFMIVDAVVAFAEHTEPNEMGELRRAQTRCLMCFLLGGLVKLLGVLSQGTFFGVLGESSIGRCRQVLFVNMLRQDIGFYDNPANTPARLVKALQVYAYRITELCANIGENVDMVAAVLAGVIISYVYQWRIALLMSVLLPLVGLATYIELRIQYHLATEDDQGLKEASHMVSDSLSAHGARTVHASSAEDVAVELYSKLVCSKTQLGRAYIGSGAAYAASKGIPFLVLVTGYFYMGLLLQRGQATLSDSLRAFMGILYCGIGAAFAFQVLGDLTKAKVAAHDLFEIMDHESLINGLEANGDMLTEEGDSVGRIEFVHVNFLYPWRQNVSVLRDMSFTIEAGQSIGICGPSGGGKSTLFSLLQRYYDPTGGRVLIGASGTSLDQLNVRWWRRQVGYVGQEPLLFEASILDNIMYGIQDPDDDQSKDRLQEVYRTAHLGFVDSQPDGWDTQVGPRGSRLSGGQKQRVAIARALIRNPPILLFDEATSALDSASEKVVAQALQEARQGRTSLTIAHRLSTIQDCDLLMVIANGSVVESGTRKELIEKKGIYANLEEADTRSANSPSSLSMVSCGQSGAAKPP